MEVTRLIQDSVHLTEATATVTTKKKGVGIEEVKIDFFHGQEEEDTKGGKEDSNVNKSYALEKEAEASGSDIENESESLEIPFGEGEETRKKKMKTTCCHHHHRIIEQVVKEEVLEQEVLIYC